MTLSNTKLTDILGIAKLWHMYRAFPSAIRKGHGQADGSGGPRPRDVPSARLNGPNAMAGTSYPRVPLTHWWVTSSHRPIQRLVSADVVLNDGRDNL